MTINLKSRFCEINPRVTISNTCPFPGYDLLEKGVGTQNARLPGDTVVGKCATFVFKSLGIRKTFVR